MTRVIPLKKKNTICFQSAGLPEFVLLDSTMLLPMSFGFLSFLI